MGLFHEEALGLYENGFKTMGDLCEKSNCTFKSLDRLRAEF